jgi:amino acid transporter
MEVYDTLAIATPIMGLLAFACGQLLAILILRRRFAQREVLLPVQRRLQIGLYAGVAVFASLWAYLFVLCARAVLRETIKGSLLPLPLFVSVLAMAFAGLVTVSWFAIRHRTRNLQRLSLELQALSGGQTSINGEAPPNSLAPEPERPLTEKARDAVLFLGAPSYRATLEMLQKANLSSS